MWSIVWDCLHNIDFVASILYFKFKVIFSGLTLSANDLESAAQQYTIHRLYPTTRKMSAASTAGGTAVNVKFANHNSTGMTHSQSTGDVASIFGRA